MRLLLVTMFCFAMTGCLKEPPSVPSIPGQQTILLDAEVVEVCQALENEFDNYELQAPFWVDSVEWSRPVGGGEWEPLGTDTALHLPTSQGVGSVRCLIHWQGDTIIRTAHFYTCYRFVMVPTAFDRWYSYSTGWKPVINPGLLGPELEFLHWQVRSLDGTLLFETHSLEDGWNGRDDGQWIGTGTFLYHIRVKFAGEDELVFTGMFVMLG
ncbi:MAG: hypothetical protein K9J06_00075 [Flavobacteriales bacterium]|nr:hypothetical protein [Flavobacteriales bacterium]